MDRVRQTARLAAPLLQAGVTQTSLYEVFDRRCNFRPTSGREEIRAVAPTTAERGPARDPRQHRRALERPDRRTAGAARRVASDHVRADRFSLVTDFTRPDLLAGRASWFDVRRVPMASALGRKASLRGTSGISDLQECRQRSGVSEFRGRR